MSVAAGNLLTAGQVAELLSVDPATVVRMAQDGRLPYVAKLAGRTGAYLFDAAVVERFRYARGLEQKEETL